MNRQRRVYGLPLASTPKKSSKHDIQLNKYSSKQLVQPAARPTSSSSYQRFVVLPRTSNLAASLSSHPRSTVSPQSPTSVCPRRRTPNPRTHDQQAARPRNPRPAARPCTANQHIVLAPQISSFLSHLQTAGDTRTLNQRLRIGLVHSRNPDQQLGLRFARPRSFECIKRRSVEHYFRVVNGVSEAAIHKVPRSAVG